MPDLSQKVLKHLVDLMAEVSDSSNLPYTRMNMESLAVVFTPCLIRKESEDVLEVLNNSKFETRFCNMLFTALAKGEELWKQQARDRAAKVG